MLTPLKHVSLGKQKNPAITSRGVLHCPVCDSIRNPDSRRRGRQQLFQRPLLAGQHSLDHLAGWHCFVTLQSRGAVPLVGRFGQPVPYVRDRRRCYSFVFRKKVNCDLGRKED